MLAVVVVTSLHLPASWVHDLWPHMTMQGHRAPVPHMAVDSSGGLLATAGADKSAKVWDIEGGFCTHSFTGHRSAPALPCFALPCPALPCPALPCPTPHTLP